MSAPDCDLPRVHLGIAEVHLARKPVVIETVLGSCVSVLFWCRRLQAAAMCHGVLPVCPVRTVQEGDLAEALRYVDFAVRYMVGKLVVLGARREELEVKMFGGADVLPVSTRRGGLTVGRKNCEAALESIVAAGLRLTASDVGGTEGRVIYFRSDTGDVWLRRLRATEVADQSRAVACLLSSAGGGV